MDNGKIIARTFPGQIVTIPVDESETYLRNYFNRAYEANFRDRNPQTTRQLWSMTKPEYIKEDRGKTERIG